MTPQAKSRQYLEARGYTVATVEAIKRFPSKKVPPCRACGAQKMVMVRSDLFGFGDLLAFNGTNTDIIQTTDKSNMSHRWRKIQESPQARAWLNAEAGRNIVVHGWFKANNRWQVKVRYFSADDFEVTRMKDWDEPEAIPF
jgi:hypothetical protein